ncbi:MAG TPA: hypothetical protein VJM14_17410 [Burkholderiales bacterium]|nr:hypothetical protein [Burkholderiales bacterium]
MKTAALKVLFVAFAAAALAACTLQPIYNVKGAPVETPGGKPPTLAEVEKAVVRAGSALGWKMQPVRPGVMVGTITLRSHTAIVDVTFDTRTFNITYKDSVDLNYDGGNIHRNYNGWIQNLDKGIRAQLLNL